MSRNPILLLAFNRPVHFKRVLDCIKLYAPTRLYIAIDGPRNDDDKLKINEIDIHISNIDWPCKIELLKRKENLGCGKAVSEAITWFFAFEEEGIIVEDDCLPSMAFFNFMDFYLAFFRNNANVMAINGTNPLGRVDLNNNYFLSRYNFIWGWATWKNRWELYTFDLNKFSKFYIFKKVLYEFTYDIVSIRSWYRHFILVREGIINTWDYQWMFVCFGYHGLIVTPTINLVENIGMDENSTHGIIDEEYARNKAESFLISDFGIGDDKKRNKYLDNKIKRVRFQNTLFLALKSKLNKCRTGF